MDIELCFSFFIPGHQNIFDFVRFIHLGPPAKLSLGYQVFRQRKDSKDLRAPLKKKTIANRKLEHRSIWLVG
jgi:hypothetical protein